MVNLDFTDSKMHTLLKKQQILPFEFMVNTLMISP